MNASNVVAKHGSRIGLVAQSLQYLSFGAGHNSAEADTHVQNDRLKVQACTHTTRGFYGMFFLDVVQLLMTFELDSRDS